VRRSPMPARVTPLPRGKGLDRAGAPERLADVTVIRGGAKVLPFPTPKRDAITANTGRLVDAILEDASKPRKGTPEWLRQNAEKRFAASTKEGPVPEARPDLGPCLIYTGASNGNGYGQFGYGGRGGYAHRYAWERVHGPIPGDLTIDHLCRVRCCVRLEHLDLVDGVTNYLRSLEYHTVCPNGHKYSDENQPKYNERRRCGECERDAVARSSAKQLRVANGLPDRRIRHNQKAVNAAIKSVREGSVSIAQAAREVGCHPNYLGRRIWNVVKRDVFSRDDAQCVACGELAVDVQHRIARGNGGTRDSSIAYGMPNLISLCRACHETCEARDRHMHAAGYWLYSWQDPVHEPVMLQGFGGGQIAWPSCDGEWLTYEPDGDGAA